MAETTQAPTADGTNGSNSEPARVNGVAGAQLLSYVQRVERLVEERKAIQDDVKDVFAEAKAVGFDVKTIRQVLKLRGMDKDDLAEQEALLDVYMRAIEAAEKNTAK